MTPERAAAGDAPPPAESGEAPSSASAAGGAGTRGRSRFSRGARALGLTLLALVMLVVTLVWWLLTRNQESTDDAQVTGDVVPLGARVGGQIAVVYITENQHVVAGQPILQIDEADYAARVRQARAELQTAEAQAAAADEQVAVAVARASGGLRSARALVEGSNVSVTAARAQVTAAEAAAARAQADQEKARLDFERALMLRRDQAVPQAQVDAMRAAFEATTAQVKQAEAQVAAARETARVAAARVGEAAGVLRQNVDIDAEMAAARARAEQARGVVRQKQAALDQAVLQLAYTRVVAPIEGEASRLMVHAGQLLQPGQTVIQIVPANTYAVANFKETQVARMRAGQRATVSIDAFDHEIEGYVESLSGATGAVFSLLPPENASGNFVKVVQRLPIRIAWRSVPPGVWPRPGMSATVTVHIGETPRGGVAPRTGPERAALPQVPPEPVDGGVVVDGAPGDDM